MRSLHSLRNRIARSIYRATFWILSIGRSREQAVRFGHRSWKGITEQDWDTALFYANAAISSDPDWPDGYRMLGLGYEGIGNKTKARNAYRRGLRVAPADRLLLRSLGDVELELGRRTEAEIAYSRALEVAPTDRAALGKLALVMIGKNQLRGAAGLLERILTLEPDDVTTQDVLGQVRYRMGDVDGAISMLSRAAQRGMMTPLGHYHLALALRDSGRLEKAREEARRAVELDPSNSKFRDLLSKLEAATDG